MWAKMGRKLKMDYIDKKETYKRWYDGQPIFKVLYLRQIL